MKRHDALILALLAGAAALIWARDLRWLTVLPATVPLVAALPLFVWLRRPWRFDARGQLDRASAIVAIALSFAAMRWPGGWLFAAAWTAWFATWVNSRFAAPEGAKAPSLWVLPLCAFPWVVTDLTAVTGAVATSLASMAAAAIPAADALFADVALLTAVCAVAGGAGAVLHLRHTPWVWANLLLLIGAVGLAALLQLSAVATAWTLEAGSVVFGLTRVVAGVFALVVVLVLCYGVFAAQAEWLARPRLAPVSTLAAWPWVSALALVFGAWLARDLIEIWSTAVYARGGGIAFVVWLLPVLWPLRRAAAMPLPAGLRQAVLAAGVVGFFAGLASGNSAWSHVGLAAVIVTFIRRPAVALWALGAVAWLPLSQHVAIRFALDPQQFAVCRVLVATLAAMWGLGVVRHEWAARRPFRPSQPA